MFLVMQILTFAFAALLAINMSAPFERARDGAGATTTAQLFNAGGNSVGSPLVFVPPAGPAARSFPDDRPDEDRAGGAGTGLSAASAALIARKLDEASRYCQGIRQKEYVIDCLAERLADADRQLAGTEGYGEVRQAITATSRQLGLIARENRSPTQPRARFETQGATPLRTSRPLVPVDAAKLDDAVEQALTVIQEAETRLLRSAEGSQARATQFQRIANAIGSNKVLLRSVS